MSYYDESSDRLVGPRPSTTAPRAEQRNVGATSAGPSYDYVLYVQTPAQQQAATTPDARADVCEYAVKLAYDVLERNHEVSIWVQDVRSIERQDRPAWLTGVPTLASLADKMLYRGSAAIEKLTAMRDPDFTPPHKRSRTGVGGGAASGAVSTTPLSLVAASAPRRVDTTPAAPQQPSAPVPEPVSGDNSPSGAIAFAQIGQSDAPFDETLAESGNDPRYDVKDSKITTNDIERYMSTRKNYENITSAAKGAGGGSKMSAM